MTDQPIQPLPTEVVTEPTDDLPRGKIIFYCKSCRDLIDAQRIGKKYQYKCPICKSTDIAFGTEKSIKTVYKIVDKIEPTT